MNSRPEDVEDVRRELAALVVEWAGRMVKDDPASPLGQALTGAVREAAKGAVVEQYQALARKDAEHIAEAIAQHRAQSDAGRIVFALSRPALSLVCAGAAVLLVAAFAFGLLTGKAAAPRSASVPADLAETTGPSVYVPKAPALVKVAPEPHQPPEPAPAETPPRPREPVRHRTAALAPAPAAPARPAAAPVHNSASPNTGSVPAAGSAAPAAAAPAAAAAQ
jgi:hypothetical protein